MVKFHELGIIVADSLESIYALRWADIALVIVRTTDKGPFGDDIFWEFFTQEDTLVGTPTLRFSGDDAGAEEVLDIVPKRLEGFDDKKIMDAICCCEKAHFVVWSIPSLSMRPL